MADRTVQLREGRTGGLSAYGDPVAARMVVLCHPAPGSGRFDPDPSVTSRWGVHLIALDRPGYGTSSPLREEERPTVEGQADDLGQYLLRVTDEAQSSGDPRPARAGVIGWSDGGRVALSLAARYPQLVDRVAVVAAPAPDTAVRWLPAERRALLAELAALPPAEAKARLRAMVAAQTSLPAPELLGASDADRAVLDRPGLADRLDRMIAEAWRQGTTGLADDLLTYADDGWAAALGEVRAPVLLMYGGADPLVPAAHGRWYRRHLHDAHLTVLPRDGRLVLVDAWERLLAHTAPEHGRAGAAGDEG